MTNLNKPTTKLELLALFGKARDQELDHAEADLLNGLLTSDNSIRGLYRGFVAVQSGLEEIAKTQVSKIDSTSSNMAIINDTVSDIPVVDSSDSDIDIHEQ